MHNAKVLVGLGLNVEPFVNRIDRERLVSVLLDQFSDSLEESDLEDLSLDEIHSKLLKEDFIDCDSMLFWLCDPSDYLDCERISGYGDFLYCPQVWPWAMDGNWPDTENKGRELLVQAVQTLCPLVSNKEIEDSIQLLQLAE